MTIHAEHPFQDADPDPARRLRGRLGGAVTLWTAWESPGDGSPGHRTPAGLTVSSVMVANGRPAHLLALLDPDADLTEALRSSGHAAVQLLEWRHRTLAEVFAETAPAPGGKFAQTAYVDTDWGPRPADGGTWAGVALEDARDVGWSVLVTCRLEHVEIVDDGPALVHRRGRFEPPGAGRAE